MAEIKNFRKISLINTLRAMPVGSSVELSNRETRPMSVRKLCYKLNNRGYHYIASERGMINTIKVTRTK